MEQRRFALHVERVIGTKAVDKVCKADLDELLHAMVKAGMRAERNRVFTSLKGFFSWAVHQRGYLTDNPVAGKNDSQIRASQARQKAGTVAVIELDELATLWRLATWL